MGTDEVSNHLAAWCIPTTSLCCKGFHLAECLPVERLGCEKYKWAAWIQLWKVAPGFRPYWPSYETYSVVTHIA